MSALLGSDSPRPGVFAIPALDAEKTLPHVLSALNAAWAASHDGPAPIWVIDDGSTDRTAHVAREAGARVLVHEKNFGKGRALRTALGAARDEGISFVVTLDADGQHPPAEAVRLFDLDCDEGALVLGVRDLARAGAPRPNQLSNRFSNFVLSAFGGHRFRDTQCGLRRYPVRATLDLGPRDDGFAFEAEIVLRAAHRGLPIVQVETEVVYPADRVTHFDSVRDPARIVRRVLWTTWTTPHHRFVRRWGKRLVGATVALFLVLFVVHLIVRARGAIEPPELALDVPEVVTQGGLRRVGSSYAVRRNGIWEIGLTGSPSSIGLAHGRLVRDAMIENEGVLFGAFEKAIPSTILRTLVLDLAVFGYRDVARGMSPDRLEELAGQARAFTPDPYEHFFPTFQRFVYLSALYDISLSFEYSPLIGCTTFTVDSNHGSDGPLLARAFDFEVDDVFDEKKAVFFVRERNHIPFASVAWPGLVGVVSGMNLEGVSVVVHGARAGETTAYGEPVVHALRRVLSTTRSTEEAVRALDERNPMVSHLVIVTDRHGDARAIERIPGKKSFVRRLEGLQAVTNHLEGPDASDPKNQRVLTSTSTRERRARGDALVAAQRDPVAVADLVGFLRDRKDASGKPLPRGDRRAIDASIATHGVVMNPEKLELWVSRSPHLSGAFVRYSLRERLAEGYDPERPGELTSVPAAPP